MHTQQQHQQPGTRPTNVAQYLQPQPQQAHPQPQPRSNVSALNPALPSRPAFSSRQHQPHQHQQHQPHQQPPPPQQHHSHHHQQPQQPPHRHPQQPQQQQRPPTRVSSFPSLQSLAGSSSVSPSPTPTPAAAPDSPQSGRSLADSASAALRAASLSRSPSDAFLNTSSQPSTSPPPPTERRGMILECINGNGHGPSQQQQQHRCSPPPESTLRPSLSMNNLSSTATTYGTPHSSHPIGSAPRQAPNLPNWGPPLYPHAGRVADPMSLSSLYPKQPPPPVPFAPPPTPPQNIGDDPTFFELYKAVWTTFHPIHDGIERPAVQALLPPPAFWMGKRILDIGCGTGKLCRKFRAAHAQSVTGIDRSARMIQAATAREMAEENDHLSGSDGGSTGVGSALKRFFTSNFNETQLAEKLARRRGKVQAQRDAAKLAAEDARQNAGHAKALAAATAEGDRERDRLARVNSVAASSVSLGKEAAAYFKRLLKQGGGEKAEPDERVARGSASPTAGSAASPDSHPFVSVKYIHSSIEEWDTSGLLNSFHLVTCTMTMHFIWDLQAFARKVFSLLAPGGLFVSSVDHPVATACWGIHPIAFKADVRQQDVITHFPIDNYHEQGERRAKYYVDGVIKYHRRMDCYINTFLSVGLVLEKIMEPRASVEMEAKHPELKTWRRKPIFLCMRWRKPKRNDF